MLHASHFCQENKPRIIFMSETKIDSMIENSVNEIEDYVVERNDRNKLLSFAEVLYYAFYRARATVGINMVGE